nr:hypothetical protein [uncultured Trichococcus sp.]
MYPLLKKPRKIIEYPGSAGIIRKIGNTFFLKQINETAVCGKINVHTIAAQKYIAPQAA